MRPRRNSPYDLGGPLALVQVAKAATAGAQPKAPAALAERRNPPHVHERARSEHRSIANGRLQLQFPAFGGLGTYSLTVNRPPSISRLSTSWSGLIEIANLRFPLSGARSIPGAAPAI